LILLVSSSFSVLLDGLNRELLFSA